MSHERRDYLPSSSKSCFAEEGLNAKIGGLEAALGDWAVFFARMTNFFEPNLLYFSIRPHNLIPVDVHAIFHASQANVESELVIKEHDGNC